MALGRREFMQVLAVASAGGLDIAHKEVLAAGSGATERLYELPPFGNVSLMHFTDCHAQLLPIHFREPSVNLGVAAALGAESLAGGRVFVADPQGSVILSYPVDVEQNELLRDLKRLLSASGKGS